MPPPPAKRNVAAPSMFVRVGPAEIYRHAAMPGDGRSKSFEGRGKSEHGPRRDRRVVE
jgi:hypothetical protein